MLDKESHVDGTVERIQQKVGVDVFAQLSTLNAPAECQHTLPGGEA